MGLYGKSIEKERMANERFGIRRGRCLADNSVEICKFTARRILSDPPPERQAASRWVQWLANSGNNK
jgi:hypothetical protein